MLVDHDAGYILFYNRLSTAIKLLLIGISVIVIIFAICLSIIRDNERRLYLIRDSLNGLNDMINLLPIGQ